jgi:pimeloyl-ACP methyl ester carboxylesterase
MNCVTAGVLCAVGLLCWSLASAQPEFQSGQPKMVQIPDGVFEVVEYGSGETLLMLPGPGGLKTFERLTPLLVQNRCRCLILGGLRDDRGNPVQGLTLRDYALRIGQLVDRLENRPVHVIGHTGGSFAGTMLASLRPDVVKSLVVMPAGPATWPLPPASAEIQEARRKRLRIRVTDAATFQEGCRLTRFLLFSPRTSEAIVHDYVNGLLSSFKAPDGSSYRSWADTGAGTWDVASTPAGDWIEGGKVSVLGIHGLDDRIAPPELGRAWKRRLGHRARLVEVARAGHVPQVEQPAIVAKAIASFYRSLEKSPR